MKRYIFPLLLAVLLPGVGKTFAQTVTHGTFKAPAANTPVLKAVDVNYTMTVSAAKDKMTIETKANEAVTFNMDVLGADNQVLAHWSQRSGKTASATHDFDLSSLPSGSYHLSIHNHNATASNAGSSTSAMAQAAHTNNNANNSNGNSMSVSKSTKDIPFTK